MSPYAKTLLSVLSFVILLAGAPLAQAAQYKTAVFGGGSFKAMEPVFDKVKGVSKTEPGYAGGVTSSPTVKTAAKEGHIEVVRVTYDADKVSYEDLLEVYWANVDPRDAEGQFCDDGSQFTPVIFTDSDEQDRLAKIASQRVQESYLNWQEVEVAIRRLDGFHPAEKEFQDYYKNNKLGYKMYALKCGRERRLADLWKKADALKLFK